MYYTSDDHFKSLIELRSIEKRLEERGYRNSASENWGSLGSFDWNGKKLDILAIYDRKEKIYYMICKRTNGGAPKKKNKKHNSKGSAVMSKEGMKKEGMKEGDKQKVKQRGGAKMRGAKTDSVKKEGAKKKKAMELGIVENGAEGENTSGEGTREKEMK